VSSGLLLPVPGEYLKTNSTLVELNINENNLGDEGAKALAEGLKANKTLKSLDLSLNYIGDEGAKAIAAMLDVNKTLTSLTISGNEIQDAELRKKCRSRKASGAAFYAKGPSVEGYPSCLKPIN